MTAPSASTSKVHAPLTAQTLAQLRRLAFVMATVGWGLFLVLTVVGVVMPMFVSERVLSEENLYSAVYPFAAAVLLGGFMGVWGFYTLARTETVALTASEKLWLEEAKLASAAARDTMQQIAEQERGLLRYEWITLKTGYSEAVELYRDRQRGLEADLIDSGLLPVAVPSTSTTPAKSCAKKAQ